MVVFAGDRTEGPSEGHLSPRLGAQLVADSLQLTEATRDHMDRFTACRNDCVTGRQVDAAVENVGQRVRRRLRY
ncbi:hypothetical protein NJ76_26205 [Rhodococcus sp. IITR03]|nr:hypothetical protein NJ76_26205 [Rhodococcus sp. IITR03]